MASIVIKVKYDETLRRFNVAINDDQRLDLSMEGLRLKISSLFNFPSDVDFRLTYKDEDDDLVTLVDDNDLQDVVKQGLNPVRIMVHLKSDQIARSSELLMSVQEPQNLQQSGTPDVAEIMKSVQSPLAHALSKLSLDISSKATSTSPILADIFDGLSKMGQAYVNAALPNHVEVGNESKPNSDGRKHEGVKVADIDQITQATGESVGVKLPPCPSGTFDLGKNKSCESSSAKIPTSGGVKKIKDVFARNKDVFKKDPIRDALERVRGFKPYCAPIPLDECPFGGIPPGFPPLSNRSVNKADDGFSSIIRPIIHKGITCDGCEVYPIAGPRFKSKVRYDYDLCSSCFSKMGNCADYNRIDFPLAYKHPRPVKAPDAADSLAPLLHYGIGCDGCGVLPITGLRFKSKVKIDYDLCSACFSRMGNDIDYTRIEYPMAYKHPRSFKAPDVRGPCPYMRPRLLKQLRPRLDSRFIMDVNVMDGTTMAPSTPFTKIWRMRNNGPHPWNSGLQLIWIGGDRFRPSDSIDIQVPSSGVDVGLELDIAVDFTAPELPGRYISYWRMAELSGHKFGQRVWVQIQVDPSVDLTRESSSELNLNLPASNETAFPEVVGVKVEPESSVEVGQSSAPSSNLDHNHKIQMSALNFPINDDLLVASNVWNPSSVSASPPAGSVAIPGSPVVPSSTSYTEVGTYYNHISEASATISSFPNIFGESSFASPNVTIDENSNLEQPCEKTEVEEKLLKELEEMGFKQIDLNKEVLPTNENDLERSVSDVSDVSEWDPILEELKEMGFEDKDTNKKLLEKNNGSISRVVMDLIAEEEAYYKDELI